MRSSIDFSLISNASTRLSLSGISRFSVKRSRLVVSYFHAQSNSPARSPGRARHADGGKMTRGLIFDALRTNSRDDIAANLFLPTHVTRLIRVGK